MVDICKDVSSHMEIAMEARISEVESSKLSCSSSPSAADDMAEEV